VLVSPPVYGRTRRVPVPVRAPGWTRLVRRPPAWLKDCTQWALTSTLALYLAWLWLTVPVGQQD
jgi:hypothetical protein